MGEMSDTPRECPSCDADLDGGSIPEHMRQNYAPPYRWSKAIGISDGDSIHHWKCRYCGHVWARAAAPRDMQEGRGMSDDQPRALIEQAAEYLAELVRPQDPPVPLAQFWARGVELEAKLRAYLMTEQP